MKNVVGCVGVWAEGENMDYTICSLLKLCDHIAILMDRPDEATEKNVLEWKQQLPDVFTIGYSTVPPLRDPRHVRRRTKVYAAQLVEEKLKLVREIQKQTEIKILLSPDSDEIFTDEFPRILDEFWKSDFGCLRLRPISVYDKLNIIHSGGMAPHMRAYRWRDDINFTPWRYTDWYHPYEEKDVYPRVYSGFIHLNNLSDNWPRKKIIGNVPLVESVPKTKLWQIDKPAWRLSHEEYKKLILTPPTWILEDYAKLPK